MNMRKLFSLISITFLIITVITACNKDSDEFRVEDYDGYYWVEGKKIPIQKMNSKFYVVFYSADEEVFIAELLKSGIEFDNIHSEWYEFETHPYYDNTSSGVRKYYNYKIATIEGNYENVAAALSYTIYWAPYYKIEEGDGAAPTEIFYVKMRTTLAQLEKLANENFVEIMGADEYNRGWYFLACTNQSKGNSLQMANLFYESGLFEESAPGFFGRVIDH